MAALRAETSLDENRRASAIRLARSRGFDTWFVWDTPLAWSLGVLLEPGRPREDYERARRIVETMVDLWPDPNYLILLALRGYAEYRLREYQQALDWLDRADEHPFPIRPVFPTGAQNITLFRVMAEFRLGLEEDARARLEDLRPTLPTRPGPHPVVEFEMQRKLLAEAEALLEGD